MMTLKNSIHAADTTTAVVIDWLQQQQKQNRIFKYNYTGLPPK